MKSLNFKNQDLSLDDLVRGIEMDEILSKDQKDPTSVEMAYELSIETMPTESRTVMANRHYEILSSRRISPKAEKLSNVFQTLYYKKWNGSIVSSCQDVYKISVKKDSMMSLMEVDKSFFIKRGVTEDQLLELKNFSWYFKRIKLPSGQERNIQQIYIPQTVKINDSIIRQTVYNTMKSLSFLFEDE